MYNKAEDKLIGKKRVRIVNPRNGRKYSGICCREGQRRLLLGLRTSEQMQLISVVRQNIISIQSQESMQTKAPLKTEAILKEYAEVFKGEGKLDVDLHLEIDHKFC